MRKQCLPKPKLLLLCFVFFRRKIPGLPRDSMVHLVPSFREFSPSCGHGLDSHHAEHPRQSDAPDLAVGPREELLY